MKSVRELIEKRREQMRAKRSSTWINLLIRIILLVFVILVIRHFGGQ